MRECFLKREKHTRLTQVHVPYRLHSTNLMLQKMTASLDRETKDWSAYWENNRKWCWPFVWPTKWRGSNSGHVNGDPVARSILQPCNCHRSGRRVRYYCYRVVLSGIFLFLFSAETSRIRLRSCVNGRRTRETAKRVVSDGNRRDRRGRPSAIELSAGFGDRKDIAHVTGVARSIVATFLRLSALFHRRSRLLFLPGASGKRTLQSDAFNPCALFTRWRLVANWAVRFRHDATHERVRSCLTAAFRRSLRGTAELMYAV